MKQTHCFLLFFVVINLSVNAQTTTFDYTVADQTYTVPPCVDSIIVDMRGGAGGSSGAASTMTGGRGARVQATIPVTPGEDLYIYVGQGAASSLGGSNGGGNGGSSGFGGGGASDIRRGSNKGLGNRIIVAGGGGGAGFCGTCTANGGGGGETIGENGWAAGGKGGTQTFGGAGASGPNGGSGVKVPGTAGISGKGGDGGGPNGGGGGGGYYGGGGGTTVTTGIKLDNGEGGGGGGGSSYTSSLATGVIHTRGYQVGNGQIIITPVFSTTPATPGAIIGTFSVCAGSLQTYSVFPVAGAVSYIWTLPSGWTGSSTSNSINVTAGATGGTISVTAANACDTSDASTMGLTVTTALLADAGPDTSICAGSSVTLNASAGDDYSWSPATGLSCTDCPNPVASPSVTTSYEVTVSSGSCAPASDVVQVTVHALPDASVNSDATICSGDTILLNADGGIFYSWAPTADLSDPTVANPLAGPTSTTEYVVTVKGANGCTATDTVTITVNPLPTVDVTPSLHAICAGDPVNLTASGADSYNWSPGAGLSDTTTAAVIASPAATIVYTVTGTTNGCTAVSTVTITVNPLPDANAGNDTAICPGNSIQLNASGGISYSWGPPAAGVNNPNIANPIVEPTTTTTYVVTVTDANGCTAAANVTVTVEVCPGISSIKGNSEVLIFPNPANGFLNIEVDMEIKQLDIKILNIRGHVVYHNKGDNESGNYTKQVDVSSFAKGVYYLKVTDEVFHAVSKIIIQ